MSLISIDSKHQQKISLLKNNKSFQLFTEINEAQDQFKAFNQSYQHQIIIRNTFSITEKSQSNIKLAITPGFILLYQVEQIIPKSFLKIDVDLKFQVILSQDNQAKIGFSLYKNYIRDQISFYSANQRYLSLWIACLTKKINQRGFSKLYKPLSQLGKGGFASVFQALRKQDQKRFAFKTFLKDKLAQDSKLKYSLEIQIATMRKLYHQNLIHLEGVFESQSTIYIVTEKLNGGSLRDRMNQTKCKFDQLQIKKIMFQILKGLEHMHSKRIMHRDLKPENILIRKKNELQMVIVDFGLATQIDIENYLYYNCGTVGYVAPEVINLNQQKKYGPQCDIFSLGSIFHLLLTKRQLFDGNSDRLIYQKNKNMQINWGRKLYKNVEPIAFDLLKKLLIQDPKKRLNARQALNHQYFDCFGQNKQNKAQKRNRIKTQILKESFLSKIKQKFSY